MRLAESVVGLEASLANPQIVAPATLDAAYTAHLNGELAEAESLYRAVLQTEPENAGALHYLGVLLHQSNRSDEGVEMIKKSNSLEPQRADWANDLGNIHFQRNELAQAMDAFMDSVMLDRTNAVVWNNMGAAAQQMGLYIEANYSFRQAVEIDPNFVDALNNLGNLLRIQGYPTEALEYVSKALILGPTDKVSKKHLALAYYTLGRIDEAANVYRSWLEEESNNPIAAHMFAACSGSQMPQRASAQYVEHYFDDNASSFEESLLDNLAYSIPNFIDEVVRQLALPAHSTAILDLGCGTGLCGEVLAPYASELVGVDLSGNMLALAEAKNLYTSLHKQDLVEYLNSTTDTFNLVVAADTLNYFGDLAPAIQGIGNVLRSRGLVILSCELNETTSENYTLKPNGRYGHKPDYVTTLLSENNLDVVLLEPVVVRLEVEQPVNGLLVVAKRKR